MAKYRVRPITEKNQWDSFIAKNPEANFLQSWAFGQFHKNLGKKVYFLGLFEESENGKTTVDGRTVREDVDFAKENGTQVAAALVVKEPAKRGAYLTIAGGPLLDWTDKLAYQELKTIFSHLTDLAKQEKCVFIRIRPQAVESPEIEKLCERLNLKVSPMHLTADLTLQLDLTQTEDELLMQMRKNTRYEVKKVAKVGVTVEKSTDPQEIQAFYDQQVAVAKRHGFVPFSYPFLHEQFKALLEENAVMLIHSYAPLENEKDKKKLLATAFIIFYNGEAVYHYGISTEDNYRMPGSYACQWEAIKEAKARGCTRYNFWGIAPKEEKSHRFAGVSTFKRGFGGEEIQYLPAHDLIVSAWRYHATRTFETLRKKMRRL